MIIGLTYDAKEDCPVRQGQPIDFNAELDPPDTINGIIAALESGGHKVKKIGNFRNLLSQIDCLCVDIVFNISEGLVGRNRESQIPMLLELYDIPYIGSDALTLGITLDKMVSKKCFVADNIPTARSLIARSVEDLKDLGGLQFPLMVKPCYEGTSKGITSLSRVENSESLETQVRFVTNQYHQPAIVEEFIKGRECTVVVLGNDEPIPMPIVQYQIDDQLDGDAFYTSEHVRKESVNYICPAQISPELTSRLQELAVKVYKSVGCRDFGRVDFRIDENDNPYVLEINPLPCLARKDTFSFVAKEIGKSFEEMILWVLDEGLKRLKMDKQTIGTCA
ncbi:MAG: ATP-grasp domain-containing protein [Candidatus Omnitrophica bacterium]|nr:ATP-grasp domain-containing protein [Candidatus Omnitrophota bacterium]